jgi:hypothetical protein
VAATVRNALVLTGCLVVLVTLGFVAVHTLQVASAPALRQATTKVAVDASVEGGTTRLTVLDAMTVGPGQTVAPGTEFTTTSDTLAGSVPGGAPPGVGATLSCTLLVRVDLGQPVIDVQRCVPATSSPRG